MPHLPGSRALLLGGGRLRSGCRGSSLLLTLLDSGHPGSAGRIALGTQPHWRLVMELLQQLFLGRRKILYTVAFPTKHLCLETSIGNLWSPGQLCLSIYMLPFSLLFSTDGAATWDPDVGDAERVRTRPCSQGAFCPTQALASLALSIFMEQPSQGSLCCTDVMS